MFASFIIAVQECIKHPNVHNDLSPSAIASKVCSRQLNGEWKINYWSSPLAKVPLVIAQVWQNYTCVLDGSFISNLAKIAKTYRFPGRINNFLLWLFFCGRYRVYKIQTMLFTVHEHAWVLAMSLNNFRTSLFYPDTDVPYIWCLCCTVKYRNLETIFCWSRLLMWFFLLFTLHPVGQQTDQWIV